MYDKAKPRVSSVVLAVLKQSTQPHHPIFIGICMRVLHVGKFYPPHRGGMEVFLADLIEEQRNQGIDAHALVHGVPQREDPPYIRRVPVQFSLIYAPIAAGFRRALREAIQQIKPDVLHLHMPNNSAFWALTLVCAYKVPTVIHWHSDVVVSEIKWTVAFAYSIYKPFEQLLLKNCKKIFVTSPPYLSSSKPLENWKNKCQIIPLGIKSLSRNIPNPIKLEDSKGEKKLKLLSIGRLTYYKGFETLIAAVSNLPNVELLIAGDGELRHSLQALIDKLTPQGIDPPIKLLGNVSEDQKINLLKNCDVFCLASRERTEAFGIVLLEAMQFSKPCLVSDLPGSGMPWLISSGECGLLIPIEDIESWRVNIKKIQNDHKLRQKLGKSGLQALNERFDIKICERLISNQYLEILQ